MIARSYRRGFGAPLLGLFPAQYDLDALPVDYPYMVLPPVMEDMGGVTVRVAGKLHELPQYLAPDGLCGSLVPAGQFVCDRFAFVHG